MRAPFPILPAASLVAAIGIGAGLVGGPPMTGRFFSYSGVGVVAAVAAGAIGYGAGRARSAPPSSIWSLAAGTTKGILGFTAFASLALLTYAPAAIAGLAGGYLAGRRSALAPDALFFGAAWLLGHGIVQQARVWETGGWLAFPVLSLAAALVAREAWDLADLARRLEGARPLETRTSEAPRPRAVAGAALASGATVVLGIAAVAVGIGLARDSLGDAAGEPNAVLLALLAAVAGALWLLRRPDAASP